LVRTDLTSSTGVTAFLGYGHRRGLFEERHDADHSLEDRDHRLLKTVEGDTRPD